MDKIITQKRCPKCGETKAVSEFSGNRCQPDSLNIYCRVCESERGKKYYAAHLEQERKRRRKYHATHLEQERKSVKRYAAAHQEQTREYQKEWQHKHQKQMIEYSRRYENAHREQRNKSRREYRLVHPGKSREYASRWHALRMNAGGSGFTAEQWSDLQKDYNHLCAYCNQGKPLEIDHVVPLSKGGKHDICNIVPVCRSCNASKHSSSLLMFLYRRAECARLEQ